MEASCDALVSIQLAAWSKRQRRAHSLSDLASMVFPEPTQTCQSLGEVREVDCHMTKAYPKLTIALHGTNKVQATE